MVIIPSSGFKPDSFGVCIGCIVGVVVVVVVVFVAITIFYYFFNFYLGFGVCYWALFTKTCSNDFP